MHRHKTFTNKLIKEALGLTEKIWDYGFYDRYIRPGTFWEVLDYVLDNPVAAGLVLNREAWTKYHVDSRCLIRPDGV